MISLDLFGEPTAQARPRVVRQGNRVHTYDPQGDLKSKLKWQIKTQYREEPLTCPVTIDIIYYMPIPKSTSGIRKRQMLNGVIHHIKKPDIDNLQKLTLDCINKIVVEDDAQVVEIRARKMYSTKPGTVLRIVPLTHNKEEGENASSL